MAKTDTVFDPGQFWTEKHFSDQAAQGSDIQENPAVSIPSLPDWARPAQATDRDALIAALSGMANSTRAANDAARFGDPLAAALSAIGAAAGQPTPQVVANQRAQQEAQMKLAALAQLPVETLSPALVQAHPELKGMPLAVVERLAPILEKASAFNDQHYNLDQAASLMAPDQTAASIAKAKAALAANFKNGYVPKDYVHVAATNNRFAESQGNRLNQADRKLLNEMGNDLDPSKQRQGAFGVSKQVYDRAERLQSMAAAAKGNPNARQMEELAIGINAMLSGSNTGASEQVKALVPQSFVGNMAKFKEWLTNNPTGTEQQAFVSQLMDTVAREKQTAADQIRRTQLQRAAAKYSDLEQRHPTEFYTKLQSYGIQPEDYQSLKTGGYRPISAVQGPEGVAGGDLQSAAMAELRRRGIH